MKKWIALLVALVMCLSLCACSAKEQAATNEEAEETAETSEAVETEAPEAVETETPKPQAEALNIGDTITSEDWVITLTNAYTSNVLESDQSTTYWEAQEGYAFCILEFDVECLNSSKKPVDGDAIANPVAITATDNTYESWSYQYIASRLWLDFHNTYLEANLPIHAYVYTNIPSTVMNDVVTVDLDLAGTSYELKIN